jgi:hypothetical protein
MTPECIRELGEEIKHWVLHWMGRSRDLVTMLAGLSTYRPHPEVYLHMGRRTLEVLWFRGSRFGVLKPVWELTHAGHISLREEGRRLWKSCDLGPLGSKHMLGCNSWWWVSLHFPVGERWLWKPHDLAVLRSVPQCFRPCPAVHLPVGGIERLWKLNDSEGLVSRPSDSPGSKYMPACNPRGQVWMLSGSGQQFTSLWG